KQNTITNRKFKTCEYDLQVFSYAFKKTEGWDIMQQLIKLLKDSTHTVVFTGAGMSTESGLPDFRSESRGLWTQFNPDELANVNAIDQNLQEFTDFYRFRLSEITKYQPHSG